MTSWDWARVKICYT